MSSTLYWEPVRPSGGKSLDTGLKLIFQKRFGYPVKTKLDQGDVYYLQGIQDANDTHAKEIQILIDAIEKYGEIEIYEEF